MPYRFARTVKLILTKIDEADQLQDQIAGNLQRVRADLIQSVQFSVVIATLGVLGGRRPVVDINQVQHRNAPLAEG